MTRDLLALSDWLASERVVAVGHSILIIAYHLLADGVHYQDLGGDYFEKLDPQRLTRYLVKRLERLGHTVTLEKAVA